LSLQVIVIGPILGGAGALVRMIQTINGVLLYVVVDLLLCPIRAKLDLRKELGASLRDFKARDDCLLL
jgi:hypothetical protein